MILKTWASLAICAAFAGAGGCQSTQAPQAMTTAPGTLGRKASNQTTIRAQQPDMVPGSALRIPIEPVAVVSLYQPPTNGSRPASALAGSGNEPFSFSAVLQKLQGIGSTAHAPLSLAHTTILPAAGTANPSGDSLVQAVGSPPAFPGSLPPAALPGISATDNGAATTGALSEIRDPATLSQKALAAYQKMDGCIVRFNRRERIGTTDHPEETIMLTLRRDSFAVHLKWLNPASAGREVLYNSKADERKMTVLTASGDIPFMPAGKSMTLDVNSPLVRNSTRYSITDTGFLSMINRFAGNVESLSRGSFGGGSIQSLGQVRRPEFPGPVDAVEIRFPAGSEKDFPTGGKRLMCFSPETGLPVLLITWDEKGQEMEYMKYDRLQFVRLDDEDFDPKFLFAQPGKTSATAKTAGHKTTP